MRLRKMGVERKHIYIALETAKEKKISLADQIIP